MSGLELALRNAAPIALDLALTVAPGEIVALIGRSGAGKSSVLRAIAGLLTPGQGRIVCDGEPWFDSEAAINRPVHRRACGMLFQAYALFPHMRARDNIAAALGRDADRDKVERLLAETGLTGLGDRYPAQLSGGQQQRVALARALARQPRILLLDEPFSAVDRPTRRALVENLHDVRAHFRMPILLVSHDIVDVEQLADRVAVIEQGRIVQQGRVADLRKRPVSQYVEELVT